MGIPIALAAIEVALDGLPILSRNDGMRKDGYRCGKRQLITGWGFIGISERLSHFSLGSTEQFQVVSALGASLRWIVIHKAHATREPQFAPARVPILTAVSISYWGAVTVPTTAGSRHESKLPPDLRGSPGSLCFYICLRESPTGKRGFLPGDNRQDLIRRRRVGLRPFHTGIP